MLTPTHALFNLVLLGKKSKPENDKAIFWGSLAPDLSTYIFFPFQLLIGVNPGDIWNIVYFLPGWQLWFGLTHSLWLWPLLFLISKYKKWRLGTYFFASMVIHSITDFFVHAEDAYSNFAPFTDWKFISPVSYYDPKYYGDIFSTIELIGFIVLSFIIYSRLQRKSYKIALVLLNIFIIASGLIITLNLM